MELTTARLTLRDFTPGDRAALGAYQSDPRYAEFYGPEDSGGERTAELLEMFLQWSIERPRQNFQLAIVERDASPAPIGCCGVRFKGLDEGVAEFGLELAPRCWGRGLAAEAASALLAHAFQELGLRITLAISVTENHRITRLLGKLGFHSTGTRAGPDWMQARGWSETEWRLTAEEWKTSRPDNPA